MIPLPSPRVQNIEAAKHQSHPRTSHFTYHYPPEPLPLHHHTPQNGRLTRHNLLHTRSHRPPRQHNHARHDPSAPHRPRRDSLPRDRQRDSKSQHRGHLRGRLVNLDAGVLGWRGVVLTRQET